MIFVKDFELFKKLFEQMKGDKYQLIGGHKLRPKTFEIIDADKDYYLSFSYYFTSSTGCIFFSQYVAKTSSNAQEMLSYFGEHASVPENLDVSLKDGVVTVK